MEQLTNRERAIITAALRIIMVTVRDESRSWYVDGEPQAVKENEVQDLLVELADTPTPGEAADLHSKELEG